MPRPLDRTPITVTLLAYQWEILRGAARRASAVDWRRSERRNRPLPPDGVDLNEFRARELDGAAGEIQRALHPEMTEVAIRVEVEEP